MAGRFLTARTFRRVAYAAVLAVLLIAATQSYQDLAAARDRSRELDLRTRVVEAEIEHLQRATEAIQTDAATMERVARRELGLVREGEVVLILPPAEPEAPAVADSTDS